MLRSSLSRASTSCLRGLSAAASSSSLQPRFLSSSVSRLSDNLQKPLAFAFDIDGVLKAGPNVLPEAKRALQILEGNNPRKQKIPYIFITNGGGKHESARAKDLARELEVPVTQDQVIQAHTVMKSLVPLYGDKPILMIGGPETPPNAAREVMQSYGFQNVYTALDLHAHAPAAWPFSTVHPDQLPYVRREDFSKIRFAAILVFHDSREWGRDTQIIIDILRSHNGVFGTEHPPTEPLPDKQIPIYFSHGDLLWGNDHSVVRFGQGAFRLAIENVYKHTTGRDMESVVFGKPHRITYDYANELLRQHLISMSGAETAEAAKAVGPSVWMVGDNTESDIKGAVDFGWSSALVRTGVYKDHNGPPNHKPTILVDNVEQAVIEAIQREWKL
ncbi:HAD-superfamily hydrolase, subfamily IIA [Kalmanozyma brasiliensis GHG001]|uniref:Putative phosphatase n=1 Tax=Kalmanozyma brasiliensis (strain GHG001) TaxID=1365824 RepID=V5GSK6_KALBG|nr:HAD-superfamily hydrolase, subfamily IIA [Kalmanozyma brasiliensis GHG001]EST08907.1 HAD-superfamily hydrolase, subfamily IIA [Kalmanozyma brasiliensis GHG001]